MSIIKHADVVIIGSGIVGNACAYYCVKKGLSVIVLDEDIIGNGASGRNGGGVRAFFRNPLELPLAKYAIDNIWPYLSEELGADIEFKQGGNFRLGIGDEQDAALVKLAAKDNALGLKVDILSGKDVQEFCQFVSPEVTSAAYCHNDGHANPLVTTLAFYRKARELGAKYYTGEEIIKLKAVRGRVRQAIAANGDCYEGEHVIVAAGCATTNLVKTVGVDIPHRPRLGEAFVTEAAPHMFDFMISIANAAFYGHQTKHGSFVIGGGSGYELFRDVDYERTPTMQITAPFVMKRIMKAFPSLGSLKIIRTWAGWTNNTKDGCAVIGPVDDLPGLYVAAGFNGHGFCTGPIVGKLLSEEIVGETPCVEYKQLSLSRLYAVQ